jgi:cyclopropane-fatty-acyl-phospholipid synthase
MTRSEAGTSIPGASVIDQFFRRIAHGGLKRLEEGRLVIADSLGEAQYGDPAAPAVRIVVDDLSFYRDLCLRGSLGAASGYMDGKWQCQDLNDAFRLFLRNERNADGLDGGPARLSSWLESLRHWWRRNTPAGSRRNILEHYDLGNDLFELFLDDTMTYSAGIYPSAESSLREASVHKLDTICRKLEIGPQDHVLEIGTGWGSFAIHAAKQYGCRVTTTTISDAQFEMARARVVREGLQDRVEILKEDYRNLEGEYDKLVSIEMLEAVGHDNLDTYFRQCARRLKDDGVMLVQVISMPEQRYDQYLKNSDFIQKYIFPGSCCPALGAMLTAVKRTTDMKIVHLEDIAGHYARTLRDWRANFDRNEQKVRALGYSERFLRMWRYYLCYCETGFAERYLSDYQIVLARPGNRGDRADGSI